MSGPAVSSTGTRERRSGRKRCGVASRQGLPLGRDGPRGLELLAVGRPLRPLPTLCGIGAERRGWLCGLAGMQFRGRRLYRASGNIGLFWWSKWENLKSFENCHGSANTGGGSGALARLLYVSSYLYDPALLLWFCSGFALSFALTSRTQDGCTVWLHLIVIKALARVQMFNKPPAREGEVIAVSQKCAPKSRTPRARTKQVQNPVKHGQITELGKRWDKRAL